MDWSSACSDLQGFGPGPTQTGLYSYMAWLEAWSFGSIVLSVKRKQRRWSAVQLLHRWSPPLLSYIYRQKSSFLMTRLKYNIMSNEWCYVKRTMPHCENYRCLGHLTEWDTQTNQFLIKGMFKCVKQSPELCSRNTALFFILFFHFIFFYVLCKN